MQNSAAPNPFGLGSQIFSASSVEETLPEPKSDQVSDAESEGSDTSTSDESLITAMATTTLDVSPWNSAPSYYPLYLSTSSEYLPPPPKTKLPDGAQIEDLMDDDGKHGKGANWAFEAYENSLEVDQVFDRFTKRVGYEGRQCVR